MGAGCLVWRPPVRPGHTPLCCRSSGLRSLAPLSRCERGVGLLLRGSAPAWVSSCPGPFLKWGMRGF